MSYVAMRPIKLADVQYCVGDTIPNDAIAPGRAKALIGNQRIAECSIDPEEGIVEIAVPITGAGGEKTTMEMAADDVVETLRIMQQNADNAAAELETVTNEKILILIHNTDSRQTVKKAAKAQAEKLAETAEQ